MRNLCKNPRRPNENSSTLCENLTARQILTHSCQNLAAKIAKMTQITKATRTTTRLKVLFIALIAFTSAVCHADMRAYKIASWNLGSPYSAQSHRGAQVSIEQKWNNTIRALLMGNNGADIVLLQRVSAMPAFATFLNTFTLPYANTIPIHEYQWDLGKGIGSVFVYFVRADASAQELNLAIVSKKRAQEMFIIKPYDKRTPPLFGIRLGEDVFLSADFASKKSADSAKVLGSVLDFFAAMPNANDIQWLVAGSFSTTPQALQASIAPKIQERINIIATSTPTRKSGGNLDYAISGNSGENPYLAPPLKAYLGYGSIRAPFDSDFIPINISR
ncbi:hypothetical protein BKN38_05720 [Helicobacter sp. CLO-3]|uniref:cytolethal distending toxin subunit B family protein n=1 Tax=unclassified Helicobacter TaxID=2593540 RepID=UPI000805E26B|nr:MULTISPECIES: cytolethal distending toxin subunit B family protein [unclassified Helicobacter]OBV29975.1 hypothetical protein BA723_03230 [Helicobacter sp. CLO-3]OHU83205.1 hypothetical protein BKN38_05720 [Helicobacter sp. CLO-3]